MGRPSTADSESALSEPVVVTEPLDLSVRRTVMRQRLPLMSAVLGAALVLSAVGCGTQQSSTGGRQEGSAATTTTSSAPQVEVQSVTMRQSGGIAGVDRTWRVTSDTPGAARVFAAAADDDLRAASEPSTPICCDFFAYDIAISYSGGEALQIVTSDGQKQSPAVESLVNAVLATDPATPDR